MQKFCLALDLKNELEAIKSYEKYHNQVWPEIIESIRKSGILTMEIYRIENRLMMLIEADDEFSFAKKSTLDLHNSIVQEWESLMNQYQNPLSSTVNGEKWILMKKIFDLQDY